MTRRALLAASPSQNPHWNRKRAMSESSLAPADPAACQMAPAAPAPVDFAHLKRYTLGDRALELEVLHLFAAQAPLTLEVLRRAHTTRAWRDAAHTLKGSARAVG